MRIKLYLLVLLAAALLSGCEALKGQDGADAPNGIQGPEGPQGPRGPTGELGFPCDPPCIDLDSVAPDAVVPGKLAPGSVDADAVCSDAVGASELMQPSVGTTQIAAGAVSADLFEDGAVIAGKIAPDGVIATKVGLNAVEYGDIADNVIGGDQVAPGAVNQMWVYRRAGTFSACAPVLQMPLQPPTVRGGLYLVLFEATVNGANADDLYFTIDYRDQVPATFDTLTNHHLWMVTAATPWSYTIQLSWAGELYPSALNAIQARCSGLGAGTTYTDPVLTVIEFSTADVTSLP